MQNAFVKLLTLLLVYEKLNGHFNHGWLVTFSPILGTFALMLLAEVLSKITVTRYR